jgi:hypothetical protein
MMTERIADVPSKVTRLDQSGIGRAIDVVRQDPVMLRQTAAQLRTDPRSVIDQVFQLTPQQQAGLAALPDSQIRELGNLVAEALIRDPGSLEYSYTLMPAPGADQPQELRCKTTVKALGAEVGVELDTNKPQGPAKPQEQTKKE